MMIALKGWDALNKELQNFLIMRKMSKAAKETGAFTEGVH